MVVHRDSLVQLGGFDPELRVMEDWDLWIRLATEFRGVAVQDALLAHTFHPGSATFAEIGRFDLELRIIRHKHRELFKAWRVAANGTEIYRGLVWRLWQAGAYRDAIRVAAHGLRRHGDARALRFALRQLARAVPDLTGRRVRETDASWLTELGRVP
jgi:hypothetical protein